MTNRVCLALAALAACGTEPKSFAPLHHREATLAARCPAAADFVVESEAALNAAVASAAPGAVIAVKGMIGIGGHEVPELGSFTGPDLATPGLTLTCATPGSGLYVQPGAYVDELVVVRAPGVTVQNLILDASGVQDSALLALGDGSTGAGAAGVRLSRSQVTCAFLCAFFVSTPGAIVTDNVFTAHEFNGFGALSGVHLQGRIDGAVIERNTITTDTLSSARPFGAIRARDGVHVTIRDNTVLGPWYNGLALANLQDSTIEGNLSAPLAGGEQGAYRAGIWMAAAMNRDLIRNNRAVGAGWSPLARDLSVRGGLVAIRGCFNVFVGNNFQDEANGIGVRLGAGTGANTFAGNANAVIDEGHFDCDGDGVPDPNRFSGPGRVQGGLGNSISDAVSEAPHGRAR